VIFRLHRCPATGYKNPGKCSVKINRSFTKLLWITNLRRLDPPMDYGNIFRGFRSHVEILASQTINADKCNEQHIVVYGSFHSANEPGIGVYFRAPSAPCCWK